MPMTRSQTAAIQIRELSEQVKALTTQVEQLADDELRLQDELSNAANDRDEFQELYDDQVDENAQLLAELKTLREDYEHLSHHADKDFWTANVELRDQVDELEETNEKLELKNLELEKENARLREGFEKLKVATNPPPGFAGHNPALVPK